MDLALQEYTGRHPEPSLLRRGDAQLVAGLGVMIAPLNVLCGIDQVARIVQEIGAGSESAIVEQRVVGVIFVLVMVTRQIGARIDNIEVVDLAFDGESR